MSIGADIYAGLYANEDWRGTLLADTVDAFACVCAGIQNDAQDSNIGIVIMNSGSIHVLTANEPEGLIKNNSVWIFTDAFGSTTNVRVKGIKRRQGLTTLSPLEAVNQ